MPFAALLDPYYRWPQGLLRPATINLSSSTGYRAGALYAEHETFADISNDLPQTCRA